jgi:protein-tyrosine phosphatase
VEEAVRYVNIPILPDADDHAALGHLNSPLPERYYRYLRRAADRFVEVLETIAADDALPLVFHCSAGKDRTGVVAALLLGCLGVDSETVVSDYAVTQHAQDEIAAFLRRRRSYARLVDQLTPDALGSEPETMREFLRLLDERHGGARSWARAAGLSGATLGRLEATLLEPGE